MLIIKLVLLLFFYSNTTKGSNISIKYEEYLCNDDIDQCKTEYTQEAITSQKETALIVVSSELPKLQKGMLQITASLDSLYIAGAKLTEIEPGTFDRQNITKIADLSNNELTTIRSGTFKNFTAEHLYLNHNKIYYIEKEAIANMPNLTLVDFSDNNITNINVNWFINTPNLDLLDLSSNKISKLCEKCFDFMTKDSEVIISVHHNIITEIHLKAFDGIILNVLGLAYNHLEELPKSFYNLTVANVILHENPLKCETQKELKEFKKNHNVFLSYEFDNDC